mmetsp:Transcript_8057/g.9992  ORF Transcript_8057/g.9992 Transcript_8057/m.9992 type:complete len:286 (+) Transcript_8057:2814-3671(+)
MPPSFILSAAEALGATASLGTSVLFSVASHFFGTPEREGIIGFLTGEASSDSLSVSYSESVSYSDSSSVSSSVLSSVSSSSSSVSSFETFVFFPTRATPSVVTELSRVKPGITVRLAGDGAEGRVIGLLFSFIPREGLSFFVRSDTEPNVRLGVVLFGLIPTITLPPLFASNISGSSGFGKSRAGRSGVFEGDLSVFLECLSSFFCLKGRKDLRLVWVAFEVGFKRFSASFSSATGGSCTVFGDGGCFGDGKGDWAIGRGFGFVLRWVISNSKLISRTKKSITRS